MNINSWVKKIESLLNSKTKLNKLSINALDSIKPYNSKNAAKSIIKALNFIKKNK